MLFCLTMIIIIVLDLTENEKIHEMKRMSNDDISSIDYSIVAEPLQLSSSSRVIGPYFESNRTSTSVTARAGQMVLFDCAVVLLQGRTVSFFSFYYY